MSGCSPVLEDPEVPPSDPEGPAAEGAGPPPPSDRRDSADRRARPERRKRDVPVAFDRRSGIDRRSGLDRRHVGTPRRINEYDLDVETMAFIAAVQDFKARSGKAFPTWSEILLILKDLGYRKQAEGEGE